MKKKLSFILIYFMILIFSCGICVCAAEEQMTQTTQSPKYELKIVNEAVNFVTNQPITVTTTVDDSPLNDQDPLLEKGKKVVIRIQGVTAGRKIGWIVYKKESSNQPADFNEAIFVVGDEISSAEKKTMKEIRNLNKSVEVVSFEMPESNLEIIIREINDKIRFYNSAPSGNLNIESPPEFIRSKKKFKISSTPYKVENSVATAIQNVTYKVYDEEDLSYENDYFSSKILGVKPTQGEFVSKRTPIIVQDINDNVGVYHVEIGYEFQEVYVKDSEVKIYDNKNAEQSPTEVRNDNQGKIYAIVSNDKVTITAEDKVGKEVIGWKIENADGTGTTSMEVIENGTSGKELFLDKEMSRYNKKTLTFIYDSKDKNKIRSISPIYKEDSKYRITVEQKAESKANIEIKPDSNNLAAQTEVTFVVTPKVSGKKVKALYYTYNDEGKKIDYKDGGITIYMPAFDMKITDVELEDKVIQSNPNSDNDSGSSSNSASDSGISLDSSSSQKNEKMEKPKTPQATDTMKQEVFEDVKAGDWFAEAVSFVRRHDLMRGTGDAMFSPNKMTSRAMFITILHRLSGTIATEKKVNFKDVAADTYYKDALDWAVQNEIVKGFEDGTFRGNDEITREQVAAILFQYAKRQKQDTLKRAYLEKFRDESKISSYAKEALQWAHEEGLILGKGEFLAPKESATRAEIATVFMRFIDRFKK